MLARLLPTPLHPAVVHFPIALAVLLPVVVAVVLLARSRGATNRWLWGVVVVLQATVVLSGFVAKQTGETDEEVVEEVVPHDALEAHEEAADRFVLVSLVVLAASVAGLSSGGLGRAARPLTLLGAVAVLVAGWQVGHAGGELVYRHGAAGAHVDAVEVPTDRD